MTPKIFNALALRIKNGTATHAERGEFVTEAIRLKAGVSAISAFIDEQVDKNQSVH